MQAPPFARARKYSATEGKQSFRRRRRAWHTGDFAVMLLRDGAAGAIVSNGEHFKGPAEIGHFTRCPDRVRQSNADQSGVLELTGGTTGITASASEIIGSYVEYRLMT